MRRTHGPETDWAQETKTVEKTGRTHRKGYILKGKGGIFNYKHGVSPIFLINFNSSHEVSAITNSN